MGKAQSADTTQYYPIYFAPDLDHSWMTNPGVLVDVNNFIPSHRGTLKTHQCAPVQTAFSASANTYAGDFLYGAIIKTVAGVGRLIYGNTTHLLELDTVSGYLNRKTLDATASDFDFTSYGNDIIAVDKANNPQVSSSTTFSDLGGTPPKASVCTTNRNFVILGDCNDGVNDLGDQVWWSGIGNDATWTPSASTQAGNLRIVDAPGKITALYNMRDAVAVYKEDSLHLLEYQGSPLLWTSRLISDKAGCASKHGIAVANGLHYFLHRTGVMRFDGASVQNIGAPVNRYLFDAMVQQANFATVQAAYDEYENVIMWFFKRDDDSTLNRTRALAYNVVTGRFGYVSAAWTGDGTGTAGRCEGVIDATMSDIASWDSSLGTTIGNILTTGTDDLSHAGVLRIPVWGTAGQSTASSLVLTTGDIGDDVSKTKLARVQPKLLQCDPDFGGLAPALLCEVFGKPSQSDDYGSGTPFTTDTTRRRFDGTLTERYIKIEVPVYNYGEISGLYLTTTLAGTE